MTDRKLSKLNQSFAAFGRNPHGFLNYRWMHSTDLFYMYETGGTETRQTEGGIYYVENVYEKHPYTRIYGSRWLLAKWEPPVPEDEWIRTVGRAFPWPRHGEYHPIESTVLPEGMEPDEDLTIYTVRKLYEHLGMKHSDHLNAAKEQLAKGQKADASQLSDIVDDTLLYKGGIPGKKMHVSYGGI